MKDILENEINISLVWRKRLHTIKAQAYKPYGNMPAYNGEFDGLRIRLGSKSFELMPFAFSPKEARPSLYTLFELYDASDAVNEQNLRSRLISRLLKFSPDKNKADSG